MHGTSDTDDPACAVDLDALRRAIDATDDALLDTLHRRATLVRRVAAWKEAHARPFYVPERERQVIARLEARNVERGGAFPTESVRAVFSEVMSACLSLEQRLRVAYLGPEATFTHQASRSRFGLSARYLPAPTLAAVFGEVGQGRADLGVVPVESSSEGVVSHALDALLDADLVIAQEIAIEVSHCLVTRAAALADVAKVYAHPHALGQCRGWLGTHLPGAAVIEVASTALAARLARDDTASAAVASELAARLYDLRVAERRIEDERAPVTRFLVVARPDDPRAHNPPSANGVGASGVGAGGVGAGDKTSLLFTLLDGPGGLQHALAPFAATGVNLTRIESRPSRRRAGEHVFFIDLDGHVTADPVARALAAFRERCELVKLLGSYPTAETGAEP